MKSLKKKTTLLAATSMMVALSATSSFAQSSDDPFSGGYIGGAVTLNKSNTNAGVTPNTPVTLESKSKIGNGLYAGFGQQLDNIYLGFEGAFYYNWNVSPTASFTGTNTGLKSKNTYDILGRAGFVAGNGLIYGLAGYTSTKYETFGLATNANRRLGGLRYGGGIEFGVDALHSTVRLEYSHANYKDWNVVSGANTINFNPSEHRFLLGVSSYF